MYEIFLEYCHIFPKKIAKNVEFFFLFLSSSDKCMLQSIKIHHFPTAVCGMR